MDEGVVSCLNVFGGGFVGWRTFFFGDGKMAKFLAESHSAVGDGGGILPDGIKEVMFRRRDAHVCAPLSAFHDFFLYERSHAEVRSDGHSMNGKIGSAEFIPVGDLAGINVVKLLHGDGLDGIGGMYDENECVRGENDIDGSSQGVRLAFGECAFGGCNVGGAIRERIDTDRCTSSEAENRRRRMRLGV